MQLRLLGHSGLTVSPLCFGGNVFGWTTGETTSFRLLDAFVGAGFNFIDTADVYSKWVPGNQGGESETVLGKWLKRDGNRQKVVIATKLGSDMGPGEKGLSRSYMVHAVEASLRRLQTNYIDLYQSHQDDPETPLEETLEAFAQLVQQGKVRAIGASNFSAERLTQSLEVSRRHNWPSYQSLQPLYNLYDRAGYETELEPVCQKNGLGVIPYFSLASGFLTGKYRSKADLAQKARGGIVEKYLNDRGLKIISALDRNARRYGSTPTKVALAWLLARPSITAPIASATNLEQLNELIDATNLMLDAATIQELTQASAYEQNAAAS